MIRGGQRPNPPLSCLRFVPFITQILLSRDWLKGNSPPRVWGCFDIATFRTIAVAFAFWTFAALASPLVLRPANLGRESFRFFVISKFVKRFPDLFSSYYVFRLDFLVLKLLPHLVSFGQRFFVWFLDFGRTFVPRRRRGRAFGETCFW